MVSATAIPLASLKYGVTDSPSEVAVSCAWVASCSFTYSLVNLTFIMKEPANTSIKKTSKLELNWVDSLIILLYLRT